MQTDKKRLRPIWLDEAARKVQVIDQRYLPHEWVVKSLAGVDDTIEAIKQMVVRGAPLIGATGALGVFLSLVEAGGQRDDERLAADCRRLKDARPTAVNLAWAVDRVMTAALTVEDPDGRMRVALAEAQAIIEEEADNGRKIGEYGMGLLQDISRKKNGAAVNVLTHCNAGWLACIEYGTATAPVYQAFDAGIPVHVWVDETRPLNQGARLTAWELRQYGVAHTLIADNAGGHLMQHGMVDIVIVGTDRTTRTGDVANKIGTYLKALAARDNGVPFYVALPSSTFDWRLTDGVKQIPIEERDPDEIRYIQGLNQGSRVEKILISPQDCPAANPAFDVTPARLVTGFITERGICPASEQGIRSLFREKIQKQRIDQ